MNDGSYAKNYDSRTRLFVAQTLFEHVYAADSLGPSEAFRLLAAEDVSEAVEESHFAFDLANGQNDVNMLGTECREWLECMLGGRLSLHVVLATEVFLDNAMQWASRSSDKHRKYDMLFAGASVIAIGFATNCRSGVQNLENACQAIVSSSRAFGSAVVESGALLCAAYSLVVANVDYKRVLVESCESLTRCDLSS